MASKPCYNCGHARNQHSRNGCTTCSCPVTYMDLSQRPAVISAPTPEGVPCPSVTR